MKISLGRFLTFTMILLSSLTAFAGSFAALYSFCSVTGCTDGSQSVAGLIQDTAGNLYGTTSDGGANTGANSGKGGGTVFKLAPPAQPGGEWTETVLYSFCSAKNCTDGESPLAGLIQDTAGNLYGTTEYGGANTGAFGGQGGGTIFELAPPAQPAGAWTETVLYSFCSVGAPYNYSHRPGSFDGQCAPGGRGSVGADRHLLSHGLVNRNIGARTPGFRDDISVAAVNDVPGAVRRTPHRKIGFSVAIVIAGNRDIPGCAPSFYNFLTIAGLQNEPGADRRAEYGDVSLAIAVVIAGYGDVSLRAPSLCDHLAVAALNDVPGGVGGAEDGKVGLAIAVIVAGHWYISRYTPGFGDFCPVAAVNGVMRYAARQVHR
jgi:hypothetical protein